MILAEPDWTQDASSDMNAQFTAEEDEEIELFLATHKDWKMTETGTGLRYMIYSKSESLDSATALPYLNTLLHLAENQHSET